MEEIFKLYKDTSFHGNGAKWEISNFGRVKKNGEIYEPVFTGGYYRIGPAFVHRIVYELFKGEIPEGYVVDHIDTNVRNNHIDNLHACSQSENLKNPITLNRLSNSMKGNTNGSGNKGRKFTEETKRKMSLSRKAYLKNKIKLK